MQASNDPPRIGTYHYKCDTCGKEWVKRNSRGGGDTCRRCSRKEPVYPHRFEEKKSARPKRMFGEFSCICGNSWFSGNSWEGKGQQCRIQKCKKMVQPHTLRPLLPSDGSGKGEHMQELCEMCQELGRNCRNAVDLHVDIEDDDTESVVSSISTASDVIVSNLTPTGSDDERSQSGSDTEDELAEDLLRLKLTKR